MRNDKIFDNNFDSPDFELNGQIKFDLDPSMEDSRSQEEQIHYEIIARNIHDLIQNSRFKIFNEVDDLGRCTKLKKADINEVYGFIVDELVANYSRIDLYSELCVYFDIKPDKFYSSLSNVYKEDLIQELDIRTGILDKKNIKKLF
jgi:hypothetical protein